MRSLSVQILTFTQYSDIVEYAGNNEGGRSW